MQTSASVTRALAALSLFLGACSAPASNPMSAGLPVVERSGAVRAAGVMQPNRTASWMAANPDAGCPYNGSIPPCGLLYVSNYYADDVLVYSDNALVGTLTGFDGPDGVCNDRAGDVWITNNLGASIVEYAHGGSSPIGSLQDPNVYPLGCSVDPTTGDLAVANVYQTDGAQGSIAIYRGAKGSPKILTDAEIYYVYFCGYDDAGNLFLDGRNAAGAFQFAELPAGKKKFTSITLTGATIYFPGKVQWDGRHVDVGDQEYLNSEHSAIYRTTGAAGEVVGTTLLSGAHDVVGYAIHGGSVIGPDANRNNVALYKFPIGGTATAKISGFDGPYGAAISRKPTSDRVPAIYPSPAAQPAQAAGPGWISPAAKSDSAFVYVADGDEVLIYPEQGKNPPPIGMISDGVSGAYGLYVDRHGNLYVANDGNNSVTEYAQGSLSPSATYSGNLSRPLYPLVDRKGNLWVGNANNGTVVEFLHGHTTPHKILQTLGTEADGMDFDSSGNLYVAYRNYYYYNGSIEEFAPGSIVGRDLGMQLNQPQGVIVSTTGTILAVETGGTNRIDVFAAGSNTPALEVGVSGTPTQIAITEPEHKLLVSTLEKGTVYEIRFPLNNPNGSPNVLHEKIDVGNNGTQGLALSNGQYF